MIKIQVTIEEEDKEKLLAMKDRASGRMIEWARWGLVAARTSVLREFAATEWKMPGGGVWAWPPRKKEAQGHPLLRMFPADHAEKHGGARQLLESYTHGLHGFFKGVALAVASRKYGAMRIIAVFGFIDNYRIFHGPYLLG